MTVGATDTWSESRDEIISDALANVGAIGPGETATGRTRDFAARALNRIVKALDAEGQFLWRMSRLTFTTTAATASYALSARAFDIDAPMSYVPAAGTGRVSMLPMTRDEYMALTDRTVSGTPGRYFIEKTLTGAGRILCTAILWPVPDTTSDTIEYAAALRAEDYVTGADTSPFPSSWVRALVYALSAELAPGYAQPALVEVYRDQFETEIGKQVGSDNEKQNLILVPFGGSGY